MHAPPAPPTRRIECPECERVAPEGARHCAACGQRLEVAPPRFLEVAHEFVGSVVSFELPFLRTARDLLAGPGRVASAWIRGQRKTYLDPVKFIVIAGVVVALLHEPLVHARAANAPVGQATYGLAVSIRQYFAFACLLWLAPLTFVVHSLGRRSAFASERSWPEWYVLGLFTYGMAVLLQLLLSAAAAALPVVARLVVLPWIESLLPLLMFTWGAMTFVPREQAWRAATASVLAHGLLVGLIGLVMVGIDLVSRG